MLSPEHLLSQIKRLWRNVANPPDADILPDLCADWMDLLGPHLDDAGLSAAVRAHLERSRFWPTPAELLAGSPSVTTTSPAAMKARADELFGLVVRARSSAGPDAASAPRHLAHYGVTDPAEQAACIAAVGDWRTWDPGDPNRGDARRHDFARRDFAAAYALAAPEARAGRLKLPAPPPLRLLPGPEPAPPMARLAPQRAPEPVAVPEPRRWSAAHVVAGLCSADDVGKAIPAAWRQPKAPPRHSGVGEAAESILDDVRSRHGGS